MAELTKKTDKEDLETRARQIVGAEPTLDEYSVAAPAQSDYQRSQEWYDTYFPTISKEEEQRREAQARNVARWQLFGNAAASIANAIGGWNGGAPVAIPEVKYPDLQTWKNQLNAERKARAVQEDADRKAYTTAYNTWLSGKNTYDRYNLKRKDEYQTALSKAKQMLQTQDWKEGQAEEAQKNKLESITVKGEQDRKTKQTLGAGTVSHSSSGGANEGGTGKNGKMTDQDWSDTYEQIKDKVGYPHNRAKTPSQKKAAVIDYRSKHKDAGKQGGTTSGTSGNGSNNGKKAKKVHPQLN